MRRHGRIDLPRLAPDAVIGQGTALRPLDGDGSDGGQAHVEIGFVEDLVTDVVLAQLLDGAEERSLIGHTNDYARRDFIWIVVVEASRHLESGVVGLDKLLGETDVLTDKDVKVGVGNLVLLHILEPPWLLCNTAKVQKLGDTSNLRSVSGFRLVSRSNPISSYFWGFVKPFY